MVAQTRTSLHSHEESFGKFIGDAKAAEAAHQGEMAAHFRGLQAKIEGALAEQKAEASQLDTQLMQSLDGNAASIQAALGSALQQMMADTKSLMQGHLAQASRKAQGTSDLVVQGLHEEEQKWAGFVQRQDSLREAASATSTGYGASTAKSLDAVVDRKRSAEVLVSGVSDTVGEKRTKLDDTASALVSSIDSAVAEAKKKAKGTAHSAAALLGDVNRASEGMQAGASSSIDSFQAFLGDQGYAVSGGVTAHFAALGSSLHAAKRGVSAISGDAGQYCEALLSDAPVASGNTPAKQTAFAPLTDLETLATREHGLIRKESLAGSWAGVGTATATATAAVEVAPAAEAEEAGVAAMATDGGSGNEIESTDSGSTTSATDMDVECKQEEETAPEEGVKHQPEQAEAETETEGDSSRDRRGSRSSSVTAADKGHEEAATEDVENQANAPPPAPVGRGRASSRAGTGASSSKTAAKSGLRAPSASSRARSQSRTRL